MNDPNFPVSQAGLSDKLGRTIYRVVIDKNGFILNALQGFRKALQQRLYVGGFVECWYDHSQLKWHHCVLFACQLSAPPVSVFFLEPEATLKISEIVYTIILKPKPLPQLANAYIRMLIPQSILCQGAIVMLNPRDPVVCGALALRAYEKDEIDFLASVGRPKMTVLDIGANIGLHTAILGKAIGP